MNFSLGGSAAREIGVSLGNKTFVLPHIRFVGIWPNCLSTRAVRRMEIVRTLQFYQINRVFTQLEVIHITPRPDQQRAGSVVRILPVRNVATAKMATESRRGVGDPKSDLIVANDLDRQSLPTEKAEA